MVVTLSLTPPETKTIVKGLEKYPSLPTPSPYEKARHKMGEAVVTVYTSGKIVITAKNTDVEKAVKEKLFSWMKNENDERVFGIDEVGRGEKTGPLVVGGVLGQRNELRGLRDSKKTTHIAKHYHEATQHALIDMRVSVSARMIDELRKKGLTMNDIQADIALAFHSLKEKLTPESMTLMDGKPLRKGMKGIVIFQEKADDIEPSVSAASIIAKHAKREWGRMNGRRGRPRISRPADPIKLRHAAKAPTDIKRAAGTFAEMHIQPPQEMNQPHRLAWYAHHIQKNKKAIEKIADEQSQLEIVFRRRANQYRGNLSRLTTAMLPHAKRILEMELQLHRMEILKAHLAHNLNAERQIGTPEQERKRTAETERLVQGYRRVEEDMINLLNDPKALRRRTAQMIYQSRPD